MLENNPETYADTLEGRLVDEKISPRREPVRYDHDTTVDEDTLYDERR
ncbi:MAG: hypothetical protein AAB388_01510 [Patescibacteria group bacterium]